MPDTDPGNLEKLHDIAVPPQVSWWPPAPGWYVVGAIALVLLVVGVCAVMDHWRRNRYRREALKELERITRESPSLTPIAELVKRVALAAFPRDQVASLTGDAWLNFLDTTGGTDSFTRGAGQILRDAAYQKSSPRAASEIPKLAEVVRHWIKHHKC